MFGKTNHIHFIGIGGIGMSGIAELLHKLGFNISGSDLKRSERTDNLQNLGINISEGHRNTNINGADVVVYSSAVKNNNPEMDAAVNKRIPTIRRAEMLAELLKVKTTSRIPEIAESNDIIVTMDAGNIWRQCERIYEALSH